MKRRIWQTGCRISKQRVIAQVIWERLQGGEKEGGVAQEAAPGTRHMHQPACYYAVQDSLSSTWYLYVLEYTMNDAVLKWTSQHTLHLLLYCTWYYAGMLYLAWWLTWTWTSWSMLGTWYDHTWYNIVLECTRGTILYSVPCHAMLQSRSTHPI